MLLALVLVLSQVAPIDAFATDSEGPSQEQGVTTPTETSPPNGVNTDDETQSVNGNEQTGDNTNQPSNSDDAEEKPSENNGTSQSENSGTNQTENHDDLDQQNNQQNTNDTPQNTNDGNSEDGNTNSDIKDTDDTSSMNITTFADTDDSSASHKITVTVTQDGNVIEEGDAIDAEKPIKIDAAFDMDISNVSLGERIVIEISEDFKPDALPASQSVIVDMDGTKVEICTLQYEYIDGTLCAVFVFDKPAISEKDADGNNLYFNMAGDFGLTLRYTPPTGGTPGGSVNEVKIVDKSFQLEIPTTYTVAKKGAAQLSAKSVKWTVTVGAKQLGKQSNGVALSGISFKDNLSLIGTYISDSLVVSDSNGIIDAAEYEFDVADDVLTLKFKDESKAVSPATVIFETEIPDESYYSTATSVSMKNHVDLYDSAQTEPVDSADATVKWDKPTWITKSGASDVTSKYTDGKLTWYDEKGNEITDPRDIHLAWKVNLNPSNLIMKNPKLWEFIDKNTVVTNWELTYVSTEDGEKTITLADTSIVKDDAYSDTKYEKYEIILPDDMDFTKKAQLIVSATVKDDVMQTGVNTVNQSSFYNHAELLPNEELTENKFSADATIKVGNTLFGKSAGAFDYETNLLKWNLTVNGYTSNQNLTVYELFIYGGSKLADGYSIDIDPDDATLSAIVSALNAKTNSFYQKYSGMTTETSGVTAKSYTIKDKDGNPAADLVCITGIPNNKSVKIALTTQVSQEQAILAKKVYNTAYLYDNGSPLCQASASIELKADLLRKDALKREWTSPTNGTTTASEVFDYTTNSAAFRLHVNARGLTFDEKTLGGKSLRDIVLTDTLPSGWQVKNFKDDTTWFRVYEAAENKDGGKITAPNAEPIEDVSSILTAAATDEKITFTFKELSKPYLIVVNAGPTEDTFKNYVNNAKVVTLTNTASLSFGEYKGANQTQNVSVNPIAVTKTALLDDANKIIWTVDYNSHNFDWAVDPLNVVRLEDTMPEGISLQIDPNTGKPSADVVTLTEMKPNADGTLSAIEVVPYDSYADKLSYQYSEDGKWILKLELPDTSKCYRFTYSTDITGNPGTIKNTVNLIGITNNDLGTSATFNITDSYVSATAQKYGWFEIIKNNGKTGADYEVLSGAKFGLFQNDIMLYSGTTDSNGILRFASLREGEYILKELKAPEGYQKTDKEYKVSVTRAGTIYTTKIDDDEISYYTKGHQLSVVNAKGEDIGSLKISKTVSGGAASKTQEFEFTVKLFSDETMETPLSGVYNYTGEGGVKDGSLEFKNGEATFTLKHGEAIKITGIETTAYYFVKEADNKYTTKITGDMTVKGREISGAIKQTDTAGTDTFDRIVAYNNHKSSGGSSKPDPDPEIPDPEVPLEPGPEDPGTDITDPEIPLDPGTDIPDPEVPQTEKPDDSTDIKDEDPPKSDKPSAETTKKVPKTGDEMPFAAWTLLFVIGISGALTLLTKKQKSTK